MSWATPALAQMRTGDVIINGSVGTTLSIRYWSSSLAGGAVETSAQVQEDPLQFVMNLGNVADLTNPAPYIGGRVRIGLESVLPYALSAQAFTANFGSGPGDFTPADIGFGIGDLACEGPGGGNGNGRPFQCRTITLPGSVIQAPYDNDPLSAAKVNNVPQFQATLADLASAQTLLTGPRISYPSLNGVRRPLTVETRYAVGPQFWNNRNTSFQAMVLYTISNP